MSWLLDLIEDHRAAVKYDLLAHGYRLEWLATPRLPWGDAVCLLSMQPPARSAVYRETRPDEYDRDKKLDRLETIAVLTVRGQMLAGNISGVAVRDLPRTFEELFDDPRPDTGPQVELLTLEEIDQRMGWSHTP